MAAVTVARKEVAETLQNAGLSVKYSVPDQVHPPVVVLVSVDPQLSKVQGYDATAFTYSLEVLCIAGNLTASNLDKLEDMVETVLYELGDWNIDGVSAPTLQNQGSNAFLTATVSISTTIHIGGNE